MMRTSFLQRTLALLLSTIILFALLTLGIYQVISPQIFANNKVKELLPKGRNIVSYVNKALAGDLPSYFVSTLIGSTTEQWDSTVWVVDYNGNTLIRTQQNQGRRVGTLPEELEPMLAQVLTGKECTHIGELSSYQADLAAANRQNATALSIFSILMGEEPTQPQPEPEEEVSGSMVVIGLPISYMNMPVGAVFMAQSMTEVVAGMDSLSNAIMVSIALLLLLMVPVACVFAYRFARPMRQMRDVALAMAGGNFSVRAQERDRGEIGELGGALNYLSGELSRSISDLTIERNRLRGILDGLAEGIIAMDTQGHVTHANPAVRALLGSPEEALFSPGDLTDTPELRRLFDEALNTHEDIAETITFGQTILLVVISPLEDEHGKIAGVVGILRDVTQAERLEQTRRDYVANVSHELRTPLTAMRALIEPLRDGMIPQEEQRQQVYSTLLRETMRLSRLVSDMLELSRLQSGNCSLEKHVFDPTLLLTSVYETYAQYADDIDETLNLDMPDALPPVEGNPDRTEQVLVAILDNAMKYTPEGGTVDLIVRHSVEEGLLRVSVRDSGPGIAPEDLPHVFERFYKADKAHQGKGTGLGLAIAHEIMRLLGEELSVESVYGEGSTFTFTLHTETV